MAKSYVEELDEKLKEIESSALNSEQAHQDASIFLARAQTQLLYDIRHYLREILEGNTNL